jgi:hypothetical protein
MRFNSRVLATVLAVSALQGCGSDNPVAPPVAPPPPPTPVTTTVAEGSGGGLGEGFLGTVPFRIASAGTIRATVDWTFPASTIYVYITSGPCSIDQFNDRACRVFAVSQTAAPKPRVLTVTNAAAGEYALHIGNFAGDVEAVSWHVSVTSTTGAVPPAATATVAPVRRWRQ